MVRSHLVRPCEVIEGCRRGAPHRLVIENDVDLGKDVHIEANCEGDDYCRLANRVAVIGRHDHDVTIIGYPARHAPLIGSTRIPSRYLDEQVVIGSDVWLGYGVIVLTDVKVGQGSIVAAGSVVSKRIPPYSIAAGVPARVIAQRLASLAEIARHGQAIANGRFAFAERGYDHCRIEPEFPRAGFSV